jgi:hypothetical protein
LLTLEGQAIGFILERNTSENKKKGHNSIEGESWFVCFHRYLKDASWKVAMTKNMIRGRKTIFRRRKQVMRSTGLRKTRSRLTNLSWILSGYLNTLASMHHYTRTTTLRTTAGFAAGQPGLLSSMLREDMSCVGEDDGGMDFPFKVPPFSSVSSSREYSTTKN